MNRQQQAASTRPPDSVLDILRDLNSQRRRIAALANKTGTLQTRGKRLLSASNSLAEKIERSTRGLTNTCDKTRKVLADLQWKGSGRQDGLPMPSNIVDERVVEDSPDMIEALQQAAEILKMEFAETEGSGQETLLKCERVLERTRSVWTIELPLH